MHPAGGGPRTYAILALAGVAFAFALRSPALPPAAALEAPADRFSGQRALQHIRAIAGEPRPTGSQALLRAREYLVASLRKISPLFEIEIQEGLVLESFVPGIANATRVKNIVARLPGTDSSRAIMLIAHYDSVVNAPGANDDGAGVGVALELMRALAVRGRYRNDLVVLLTDGEERGMLGARAFYQQHPRGKEPAIVFNFEARGNSGPALLFQTGPDSEWLVREFARAAPSPAASSVSQELFRILPYGTDFSVFAKGGQPGLNFAYINNTIYYHSAFDTPDSVDVRSLQHHGENALELIAGLASRSADEFPARATSTEFRAPTFFLIGEWLMVYSSRWNPFLLAGAWGMYFAFFVGFAGVARRGRRRALIWQAVAPAIVGLASALFVWLLWRGIVLSIFPDLTATLATGETYRAAFLKFGLQCAGLVFGLSLYLRGFIDRESSPSTVIGGALAFWLLAATACVFFAPGAAYLFLWPVLLALPGFGLIVRRRGDGPLLSADVPVLLLVLPALALLFAPIVRFLFFGLLTTTAQPAAMLLYGPWLFFLALPLSAAAARGPRRLISAALLAMACVGLPAGARAAAFGIEQPRPNSLFYVYDASRGRLARFSCDARLDPWARAALEDREETQSDQRASNASVARTPALGDYLPVLNACLPGLHQPAALGLDSGPWAAAGILGPGAELISETLLENGDRQLALRIRSRRNAPQLYAFLKHAGEIREVQVDGEAVPKSRLSVRASAAGAFPGDVLRKAVRLLLGGAFNLDGWTGIMLASSGRSEFLLSFTLSGAGSGEDLQMRLVDHSAGFGAVPTAGASPVPRGPGFAPGGRFPFADGVFVVQDYRF